MDRVASLYLDPGSGEVLPMKPHKGDAMGLLYVLHYELLLGRAGLFIVGAMAAVMLVLLVSGIILHQKIFTDFTFRPAHQLARTVGCAHCQLGDGVALRADDHLLKARHLVG